MWIPPVKRSLWLSNVLIIDEIELGACGNYISIRLKTQQLKFWLLSNFDILYQKLSTKNSMATDDDYCLIIPKLKDTTYQNARYCIFLRWLKLIDNSLRNNSLVFLHKIIGRTNTYSTSSRSWCILCLFLRMSFNVMVRNYFGKYKRYTTEELF